MDSNIRNISLYSPKNEDATKTISLYSPENEDATKTISLYSPENKDETKTISLYSPENKEDTKTISLYSPENKDETKTISLYSSDNYDETLTLIKEKINTEFTNNETVTILDENTKSILLTDINLKKNIKFNSLKELIQIPRYACIKYKVLNKKIQWGILYDIILFDNATILMLRKGDYLWKHKIDFNKMKYSYTKKI